MALSRVGFQVNRVAIHQVLGVRVSRDGSSGMPLRPDWERAERLARSVDHPQQAAHA
jgi:hypothetical protein